MSEQDTCPKCGAKMSIHIGMKTQYECGSTWNPKSREIDEQAACLRRQLASANAENVRLMEIVEKFPKTADGVIVTPGMRLHYVEPFSEKPFAAECRVCYEWEKRSTSSLPLPVYVSERQCYSTRELAEAAALAAKETK